MHIIGDEEAFHQSMWALSPGEYVAEFRDGLLVVLDRQGQHPVAIADDIDDLRAHDALAQAALRMDATGAFWEHRD